MVLHNSLFRSGTIYDVPDIIGLIERRIEWMDCNGINQWNKSHYRERYPDGYYIQAAEKGLLYVLTAKDSNRIIAGAVLLTQDVRWGQSNGKAYCSCYRRKECRKRDSPTNRGVYTIAGYALCEARLYSRQSKTEFMV